MMDQLNQAALAAGSKGDATDKKIDMADLDAIIGDKNADPTMKSIAISMKTHFDADKDKDSGLITVDSVQRGPDWAGSAITNNSDYAWKAPAKPAATVGLGAHYASMDDMIDQMESASNAARNKPNDPKDGKLSIDDLNAILTDKNADPQIKTDAQTLFRNFPDDSKDGLITADSLKLSNDWNGKQPLPTNTFDPDHPALIPTTAKPDANGNIVLHPFGQDATDGNGILATPIDSTGDYNLKDKDGHDHHIHVGSLPGLEGTGDYVTYPEDQALDDKAKNIYYQPVMDKTVLKNPDGSDWAAPGSQGDFAADGCNWNLGQTAWLGNNEDLKNAVRRHFGINSGDAMSKADWQAMIDDPAGTVLPFTNNHTDDAKKLQLIAKSAVGSYDQAGKDIGGLEDIANQYDGGNTKDGKLGTYDLECVLNSDKSTASQKALAYFLYQNFNTYKDCSKDGANYINVDSLVSGRMGLNSVPKNEDGSVANPALHGSFRNGKSTADDGNWTF